jgi:cellulose synthase/poly-beta-1,6-N-acetylglucosamine synthase-like glycosyltransferase
MKVLFWFSLAIVAYAYFGYALLLALYARIRRKPILTGTLTPTVSIVIAAHNEEIRLPAKLANLSALDYPHDKLQIVIASDGSTDRTISLLEAHAALPGSVILPVILPQPGGKARALNAAVAQATGEILLFLDVRQTVDPNALRELVSCFQDPHVGAVSGELLLETADGRPFDALGLYWKIEKIVRKLESATGSVVGATGAIYAIRRTLYRDLPPGAILDDVLVPMNVARQGSRVLFQPTAIARDRIFTEEGKEFARKVRTLNGNYQLVRLAPWLLSPANPLLFRFLSHKLLRLSVPFLLLLMIVAAALIPEPLYRAILAAQIVFYLFAILGHYRPSSKRFKPIALANTFAMLNLAAALALYYFVRGRRNVWL